MNGELHSLRSNFSFNGDRDYVHGPTIAEAFRKTALDALGGGPAEVAVKRFNIRRMVTVDGAIKVFDGNGAASKQSDTDALADMLCGIDEKLFFVGLYALQTTQVVERRKANEKTFVGKTQLKHPFSGTADLQNIKTNYDLIQGVVEANKQLHLKSVAAVSPERAVKFKFVTCHGFIFPEAIGEPVGKMTVNNVSRQIFDDNHYTLNQISLDFDSRKSDFTICFSSQDILDLNFD